MVVCNKFCITFISLNQFIMKNKIVISFWEVVVFLGVVFGFLFPILFEYYNMSSIVGLLYLFIILFILWLGMKKMR